MQGIGVRGIGCIPYILTDARWAAGGLVKAVTAVVRQRERYFSVRQRAQHEPIQIDRYALLEFQRPPVPRQT